MHKKEKTINTIVVKTVL